MVPGNKSAPEATEKAGNVVNAAGIATSTTETAAAARAAHAPSGKGATALAVAVGSEKVSDGLGKAGTALTAVKAAAQLANGDGKGAATSVTGAAIDKGFGAMAAGAMLYFGQPELAEPVGGLVEGVSSAFGLGDKLAGPTVDAAAKGVDRAVATVKEASDECAGISGCR